MPSFLLAVPESFENRFEERSMRGKVGPKEISVKRLLTNSREHTNSGREEVGEATVIESAPALHTKDASVEITFGKLESAWQVTERSTHFCAS